MDGRRLVLPSGERELASTAAVRFDVGVCVCVRFGEWSRVNQTERAGREDSRLGMCLSRCSLRVKLFPQYAQKTMVAQLVQTVRQWRTEDGRLRKC